MNFKGTTNSNIKNYKEQTNEENSSYVKIIQNNLWNRLLKKVSSYINIIKNKPMNKISSYKKIIKKKLMGKSPSYEVH